MSAFDWWAARIVGAPWAYTALAAEPTSEPEPVRESPMLTTYADTVDVVEAAELDVVARLHELTCAGLSPLEACKVLFNPIGEEAPGVA